MEKDGLKTPIWEQKESLRKQQTFDNALLELGISFKTKLKKNTQKKGAKKSKVSIEK